MARLTICPECKDSWAASFVNEADPNAWRQVSAASPTHVCSQSRQEASEIVVDLVSETVGETEWTPPEPEYTAPSFGPCGPWITRDQYLTCCGELVDEHELDVAINLASQILYHLSGKRFPGICERTIRPVCHNGCDRRCGCRVDDPCDLTEATLILPGPAVGVRSVFVNGIQLDTSNYVLTGYRNLVRTDGENWPQVNDIRRSARIVPRPVEKPLEEPWWDRALTQAGVECVSCEPFEPCDTHASIMGKCVKISDGFLPGVSPEYTQTLSKAAAAFDDAWEVTFFHGRPVPLGGQTAAAALACEISKARCGSSECRLPSNMSFITRQDISVAFEPMTQLLADKRTGLYEVDMWLNSVNPSRLTRRGSAFDPQRVQRQHRIIH